MHEVASRPRRVHPWLAAAVLPVVVTACSSSTAPHRPAPGIEFAAGNLGTDTVQATLTQALIVRIVGPPAGQSVAHQIVQFESVPDSNFSGDEACVEPLTSAAPAAFVADTADSVGEASVVVVLGTQAGRARVVVKVPEFGFVDTASFTVKAGAATGIRGSPLDTAVYVNGSVALHSAAVDRFGNPRTDPVTYAVVSGPATVSGSTVTVTGLGRVAISASANSARDTTYASGVPTGTIAASLDAGGIVVFNLDGSGYKKITGTAAGSVKWAPSGTSLVFDQTSAGGTFGGSALLQSVTLDGTLSVLDNSGGAIDAWPAYARDGSSIYYVKLNGAYNLWRVHPDGSGDSAVAMQNPPGAQFPSVSPDGTQLVYVVPGPGNIEILTLATGVSTGIGLAGFSAAWSPTSNLIAYLTASANIAIVHSDGSGQTTPSPATYGLQFDWSPDSKWIIARNTTTAKLELISTTSNLVIPIGFTGTVGSPTWHP